MPIAGILRHLCRNINKRKHEMSIIISIREKMQFYKK